MTDSVKIIKHLGPYEVNEIDNDILTNLVYKREVPVVLKQKINGVTRYAVLAKDKNLRIACAGCFTQDMRITDGTRCKKVSSFGKHWDTKDGLRICSCKCDEDLLDAAAEASKEVVVDTDFFARVKHRDAGFREYVLETAERGELLKACEAQGLRVSTDFFNDKDFRQSVLCTSDRKELIKACAEQGLRVVEDLDDDDLAQVCIEERGMQMLRNARPTRLIHELCRQYVGTSEDVYYGDKGACEDAVGCSLLIQGKPAKKRKVEVIYAPRTVYDFSVDRTSNLK